jgi:hypothetical protein
MPSPYRSQIKEAWLIQTPELVAYCAGFFDGEGSISFPGGYLSLSVSQRLLEPIERFQGLYGGSISYPTDKIPTYIVQAVGKEFPVGNVTYRWYRTGAANCKPILESFLPHLTVKRLQAELSLEWIGLTAVVGSNTKLPIQVASRREAIIEEIKAAKKPWLKGGGAV